MKSFSSKLEKKLIIKWWLSDDFARQINLVFSEVILRDILTLNYELFWKRWKFQPLLTLYHKIELSSIWNLVKFSKTLSHEVTQRKLSNSLDLARKSISKKITCLTSI